MSYQSLENLLGFETSLPVTEDWSAGADFLKLLGEYCIENKPEIVVECSSGTSSLVLSQCCKLNNRGHVYSLENGEEFVEQTRKHLQDRLLNEYCDVLHAGLDEITLGDEIFMWYDDMVLPDLKIDLLVIDGPSGFIQKNSRYPGLPKLHHRLAEHCTIFLDDAARDDERYIIKRWLEEFPEFDLDYLSNERGCAILTR